MCYHKDKIVNKTQYLWVKKTTAQKHYESDKRYYRIPKKSQ